MIAYARFILFRAQAECVRVLTSRRELAARAAGRQVQHGNGRLIYLPNHVERIKESRKMLVLFETPAGYAIFKVS